MWPGTHRRDGFPDLVGITCYFCKPKIFVENDNDPNACKVQNDQEDKNLGINITCTYGYDKDGVRVPARGCLSGKIGDF